MLVLGAVATPPAAVATFPPAARAAACTNAA
jgi:hypothetical protein